MYSEISKSGIDVKSKIGSLPDFNPRMPCEKVGETNRPKCFGSSDLFFCKHMECPSRKACEKLVSPWNFD